MTTVGTMDTQLRATAKVRETNQPHSSNEMQYFNKKFQNPTAYFTRTKLCTKSFELRVGLARLDN